MSIPTRLQIAEHQVPVYHHYPDAGEALEDVLKPAYWTHVAKTLRTGDRIELFAEDGTWWAMLIVRSAGSHDALVKELQYVELDVAEEGHSASSPYAIKWRGPKRKFCVHRVGDGTVLHEDFATKDAAGKWMKNHIQSLAA